MNNMRNKILSLLVLLVTAASGAWAATVDDIKVCNNSYVLVFDNWCGNGTAKPGAGSLFGDGYFLDVTGGSVATNKGTVNLSVVSQADDNHVTQAIADKYGAAYPDDHFNSWRLKNTQDRIAMKVVAGSKLIFFLQGNNKTGTDARIPKISANSDLSNALNDAPDASFPKTDAGFRYEWTAEDDGLIYIGSYNTDIFLSYLIVVVPGSGSSVDVTTNAETEGATFTEAWFDMPASDATVEYELVRDMSVQMTVQVGDGTEEQPRYRLKKQNDVYVPADMNVQQLMALVKIHDAIENKDLAFYGQTVDYTISIFAVDDNDQPTGDAVDFTALTPGRYVAQATAAQGSDYDGQTGYSNIFILYEKEITKHPVAIEGLIYSAEPQVLITPAECIGGEMRYSLDGENWSADLPAGVNEGTYTIYYKVIADENDNDPFYQTVEGIIISEMPFDDALEDLDAAIKHAIGVLALVGKDMGNVEIPLVRTIYDADDLYKLAIDPLTAGDVTSKQIVDMIKRLRDEEKAFLADSEVEEEISTGISTVGTDTGSDAWFDLNGRRLQQKPAKPGVYVKNGLKVVVK